MTSLRTSLLRPEKPLHQFHDASSLRWVEDHRPRALGPSTIPPSAVRLVSRYAPWNRGKDGWFSSRAIRDGIHGFRHGCRVAVYTLTLAKARVRFSEQELEALMFAGLLHDCRRFNDNADPRHGKRAAAWLDKHHSAVPRHLRPMFPRIRFAIAVHSDSYEDIVGMPEYKKFKRFVDIIKTGDALDRYRFHRSDWWFSERFVALSPTLREKSLAFDLVIQSESAYLDCRDSAESVALAWKSSLEKQKALI